MPTGIFEADFSRFIDSVHTAAVTLRGFETETDKVGTSLSRMADKFSGQKIIEQGLQLNRLFQTTADIAVLTDKELQRVGSTAAEAVQKMERLGMDAPAGLPRLADAATEAKKGGEGFGTSWQNIFEIFTGFSTSRIVEQVAQMLVDLGKSAFTTADHLVTLSDRTDISVEALQSLEAAGEAAGVSLDTIANGVSTLDQRLGSGATGTVGAIADLGLNLEHIKSLDAGARFIEIANALKEVKDPLEFARLASELFGNKWKELAPALKKGFDDVADGAIGMSSRTARVLDDVGDHFGALKRRAVAELSEILVNSLGVATKIERQVGSQMDQMIKNLETLEDKRFAPKIPADLDAIYQRLELQRQQINRNAEDAARATDTAMAAALALSDTRTHAHELALKQEKDLAAEQAKQLKIRNDEVILGFEQLRKLQAENTDYVLKQTLSETEYKDAKIWEWADSAIRAYEAAHGANAAYADAVYTRANQMQEALYAVTKQVEAQGDAYTELAHQAVTSFAVIGQSAAEAGVAQAQATEKAGS